MTKKLTANQKMYYDERCHFFKSLGVAAPTGIIWNKAILLSDDEIKEGDWAYDGDTLVRCDGESNCPTTLDKKVVASTDLSLGLPTIPESFIKHYVATNGAISNVLLEIWTKETLIGLLDDTYIGKLRTVDCKVIVDYEQIALQAVDGIKVLNPYSGDEEMANAAITFLESIKIPNIPITLRTYNSGTKTIRASEIFNAGWKAKENQSQYSSIREAFRRGKEKGIAKTMSESIDFAKWVDGLSSIKKSAYDYDYQRLYELWEQEKNK